MVDFERLKAEDGYHLSDSEFLGGELRKLKAMAEVFFSVDNEYFRREDVRNGFGQTLVDIHENLTKAVDILDGKRFKSF